MAKVRITKELDSRNMQYFKLTKKRGKITDREAFEAMEESYYFGEYLIQFNVPEEAPMDLYEDGDEWRIYTAKELLEEKIEEELYKAHEEGYEDCKKDFNLEGNAGNGWIPCSERLPETSESEAKAYLTINKEGEMAVSYYLHGWSNGYESVFDIIAWQPLPKPYREEQEDE
ncbi:MAG: hypothetical protein V8R90_12240 [Eubacterium sp.]